jgi:hypothetical protein
MKKQIPPLFAIVAISIAGCGSPNQTIQPTGAAANPVNHLPANLQNNSAIPDSAKKALGHAIPPLPGAAGSK